MIKFKIKNIPIRHKGILAPMLEYTHLPFRLFCKNYGAGLTITEMINYNHILEYKDLTKIDLLKTTKKESPNAIQIFGDFKNKKFLEAIQIVDDSKYFDIIDLNLGCPSQKIINSCSGAFNLKQINKILPLIKEATEISKKPITIKTRLGFSKNNILKLAPKLIDTGISALTIHGRLTTENYSNPAKMNDILYLKKNYSIPIIYNGDITENNFQKYFEFDGFMIGREALSNPFIFKQINYYLKNKQFLKKESYKKQLKLYLKYLEKYPISFQKMKISIIPFLKGEKGSSIIRDEISKTKTKEELIKVLNKLI